MTMVIKIQLNREVILTMKFNFLYTNESMHKMKWDNGNLLTSFLEQYLVGE
jgi:hypothetical protein